MCDLMCVLRCDLMCPLIVCSRYPDVIDIANQYHNGVPEMAKKWAKLIRKKANNVRGVQVRYITKVWLSKLSLHAMEVSRKVLSKPCFVNI
jgi:hypothetical protein